MSKFYTYFIISFVITSINSAYAQNQGDVRFCQGRRFKPCVCAEDVPTDVSYRPTYAGCDGNAAIITRGEYLDIFSVVVRDRENRDRWPVSGFNGCSRRLATSKFPPNRCSAFKAQKNYFQQNELGQEERVFCLGAPGTSKLFSRVTRITAKLSDVPNSSNDPLERWCLVSPTQPLN